MLPIVPVPFFTLQICAGPRGGAATSTSNVSPLATAGNVKLLAFAAVPGRVSTAFAAPCVSRSTRPVPIIPVIVPEIAKVVVVQFTATETSPTPAVPLAGETVQGFNGP